MKEKLKKNAKKLIIEFIAFFLVGVAGFSIASLSATTFNITPQMARTGTLRLVENASNVPGLTGGFNTAIDNFAQGDTVNRFVDFSNIGTLSGQSISLRVTDGGNTFLSTDPVNGLQVSIKECSVPYTANTGVCSGVESNVLPTTPMATLLTGAPLSFVNGLAAGGTTHTKFTITLPASNTLNQVTVNGVVPAWGLQGATSLLTWTFTETQRGGVSSLG